MTTFDIVEHARAVILGAKEKARHEAGLFLAIII